MKIYAKYNVGEIITETGLLINVNAPYLGFSADGFHLINSEVYLLEVKSPTVLKQPKKSFQKQNCVKEKDPIVDHLINSEIIDENLLVKKVMFLKISNGKLRLKRAHSFYGQMQLGMSLSGIHTGKLIITRGKKYITVIDVPFDHNFCVTYLETLREVYFDRILPFLVEHKTALKLRSRNQ